MAKRVLDYDPFSGITTYFHYEADTDTTVLERVQDVQPILEMNKALQNEPDAWKQGVKNSWAHYAQIPAIVIERWLTEHGVDLFNKDHQKAVFKLLNDPQYRYLKTTSKFHAG